MATDSAHNAGNGAHACCACFTHNGLDCCNAGHPEGSSPCWLCKHPVTSDSHTCPAGDCLAHYSRSTDENSPSTTWEHDDGTPCPNTYETYRCAEHGRDTRVTPPGSEDNSNG